MYFLLSLLSTAGIFLALFFIAIVIFRQQSSLIFGIYPRKGIFYHVKYYIALQLIKRLRHKFYHQSADYLDSDEFLAKIDRPQALSSDPKSYDVVAFTGASTKGEKLYISLERRRRGVLKACLYIWLPKYGLLRLPKLPDMLHFTTEDGTEANVEFRGSGFHIYAEECMRSWRINYDGKLMEINTQKLIPVKLDLQFQSTFRHFNYNRDLSGSVIADSIARESWNDAFYNMLKNVDRLLDQRMHYEQNGLFQGEIEINGEKKSTISVQMKGFRDHSFGTERCLSSINRYVYFALILNDGTNMVVGNLSQPSFCLSSLKVGYVCTPNGIYKPITSSNFELYTYGQKGKPPQHQNFIVDTAETRYFVQIKVDVIAERFHGGEWESKVYNQFLSCTVNGVQGYGIAEYLYRNKGGRPESVSSTDPEWYQRACKFERSLSNLECEEDDEVFIF